MENTEATPSASPRTEEEPILDAQGEAEFSEYLKIYKNTPLSLGKVLSSIDPVWGKVVRADLLDPRISSRPSARAIRWMRAEGDSVTRIIVSDKLSFL